MLSMTVRAEQEVTDVPVEIKFMIRKRESSPISDLRGVELR